MTGVLIVGAGPTGLVLACDLLRRGAACRIIERSPGPQPGSRGFGVKPRTLAVLDALGAARPVLDAGRPDTHLRVYLGTEPLLTRRTTARTPSPAAPYPNGVSLPEWRTEAILRERLAALGGAVEFGTSLTGFEQDADGVTATVMTDGAERTVHVAYLVGCDGGGSTVRRLAGIAFTGRTDEDARALLADVEVRGPEPRDAGHLWLGAGGIMAIRPTPGAVTSQIVVSLEPGAPAEASAAELRRLVAARSGRDDIELGEPEWLSIWRYNLRLAERYRDGRVFLAGDAAHVHSPFGAFGMNTGIQDAANLGWKLALALRARRTPSPGGTVECLLDTYEGERRPVGRAVLDASDRQFGAFTMPPRVLRPFLRGLARPVLASRDRRGRDDHPRYPAGPLTVQRVARTRVRAGDTAPDGGLRTACGTPIRLYDLYRTPGFTLLTFGDVTPLPGPHATDVRTYRIAPGTSRDIGARQMAAGSRVPDGGALTDPRGRVRRRFGVPLGAMVLVRPDGYVGLVAGPGDTGTVAAYLDRAGAGAAAYA